MSNIARQQERIDEMKAKAHQLARLAETCLQEITRLTEEMTIEVEILHLMTIPDDGGVPARDDDGRTGWYNDDETTMPTA